jgi:hypothetical protein
MDVYTVKETVPAVTRTLYSSDGSLPSTSTSLVVSLVRSQPVIKRNSSYSSLLGKTATIFVVNLIGATHEAS